ncbi:MAG: hypothetical protein K2I78_01410, partial [Clostridia bacterium]|nr:hypothetical protein [Clostridia bacterium]
DFYRRIAENACEHIADGGYLMLEVGINQAREVIKMLEGEFDCDVVKDLQGIERIVIAKKSKRETV